MSVCLIWLALIVLFCVSSFIFDRFPFSVFFLAWSRRTRFDYSNFFCSISLCLSCLFLFGFYSRWVSFAPQSGWFGCFCGLKARVGAVILFFGVLLGWRRLIGGYKLTQTQANMGRFHYFFFSLSSPAFFPNRLVAYFLIVNCACPTRFATMIALDIAFQPPS